MWLVCVLVKKTRCAPRSWQYHGCVSDQFRLENLWQRHITSLSHVRCLGEMLWAKPVSQFFLLDCSHRKGFSSHTPLISYISLSLSLFSIYRLNGRAGATSGTSLYHLKEMSITYAWHTYLDLLVNDQMPFLVRWIRAGRAQNVLCSPIHRVWPVRAPQRVAQLCPTLCDPMDCSLPGSSVHGISQGRILECKAIPFSKGSSQHRNQTWVSCIAGGFSTNWGIKKALLS